MLICLAVPHSPLASLRTWGFWEGLLGESIPEGHSAPKGPIANLASVAAELALHVDSNIAHFTPLLPA